MTPVREPAAPASVPTAERPPARILLGLGDGQREHALMAACADAGHVVVRRCLGADELLAAVRAGISDLIVASADLHRLDATALTDLLLPGRPVVLLADERLPLPDGHRAFVLPPGTDTPAILRAIELALSGQRPAGPDLAPPVSVGDTPEAAAATPTGTVLDRVIAVTGGHGSAGRTTLAINLAACLSGAGPVALVDADIRGPSLGLALNLDRKRCLYLVAHAEPQTKRDWARALDRELQPLSRRSPLAMALCGVPKPELADRISPGFMERLLAELHERYRYVVVDLGAVELAPTAVQRSVLRRTGLIALVIGADLVGLWHGHDALALLRDEPGVAPERLALVINRHTRKLHHPRRHIEFVFKRRLAAVIPEDNKRLSRALREHQVAVFHSGSRACRAMLDLAERIHGGRVELPPEPEPAPPLWRRAAAGLWWVLRTAAARVWSALSSIARIRVPLRRPRLRRQHLTEVTDDGHPVSAG